MLRRWALNLLHMRAGRRIAAHLGRRQVAPQAGTVPQEPVYRPALRSDLFQLLPLVVTPGEPPPEFEPEFYRLLHPDMEGWTEEDMRRHFAEFGAREGRIASPAAHRAGFLASIPRDRPSLEIGPFTAPVLTGPHVRYFDVLDKNGLVERANVTGFASKAIVDIDFVSPTGDLSVVGDERFDVILSCHSIEHQPDLVHHLLGVAHLLNPGGRYYVIAPDKRYSFDHFIPESDLAEVVRAHEERRRVHTIRSVYRHVAQSTHNDAVAHWAGQHDDPDEASRAERGRLSVERFHESRGAYIDVHAWQFTPASFRAIIDGLRGRGLISLHAERVYETVWQQHEFMAVLKAEG